MPNHHNQKPRFTGAVLWRAVNAYRAYIYTCDPARFETPGTTILPHERLKGTNMLYHVLLGEHTMLRPDPQLIPRIENLVAGAGANRALTVEDLAAHLGPDRVTVEGRYSTHYMDPVDFRPATAPAGFVFRHLPQDAYDTLPTLYEACSEEDLDEAEILLDEPDPVIYCGYEATADDANATDGPIVAYASHRYWGVGERDQDLDARDDPTGLLADIGVLVHPDYRHRGLGKAGVSQLTQWCIEHDVIPMYRVDQVHFRSRRIPEALGFTRAFEMIVVKVGQP